MTNIQPLAWDSTFLGRKTGSTSIDTTAHLPRVLEEAALERYDLLYVNSPRELAYRDYAGFQGVDVGGQSTYTKQPNLNGRFANTEATDNPGHAEELCQEIRKLAYLAGSLSRFRLDPLLPEGTMERLYDIWLEKIQSQTPRGGIYIYRENKCITGILTCEWEGSHSRIQLLAVDNTHQRKGIGRKLVAHHEHQAAKRNTDRIIVKTQTGNTKACRFYESAGFIEEKRSYLYHFHADSQPTPRSL